MKNILLVIQKLSLSPKLVWINNSSIRLEFKGSYLNQDKAPFTTNIVASLFIVYE